MHFTHGITREFLQTDLSGHSPRCWAESTSRFVTFGTAFRLDRPKFKHVQSNIAEKSYWSVWLVRYTVWLRRILCRERIAVHTTEQFPSLIGWDLLVDVKTNVWNFKSKARKCSWYNGSMCLHCYLPRPWLYMLLLANCMPRTWENGWKLSVGPIVSLIR